MNKHINSGAVMVTGGAGFLGSHLCDRLIEQVCDALCDDRSMWPSSMHWGDNQNALAAGLQ